MHCAWPDLIIKSSTITLALDLFTFYSRSTKFLRRQTKHPNQRQGSKGRVGAGLRKMPFFFFSIDLARETAVPSPEVRKVQSSSKHPGWTASFLSLEFQILFKFQRKVVFHSESHHLPWTRRQEEIGIEHHQRTGDIFNEQWFGPLISNQEKQE